MQEIAEQLARTWSERTEASIGELLRMTRTFDHHRPAEMWPTRPASGTNPKIRAGR
jgi:hypothetical protein